MAQNNIDFSDNPTGAGLMDDYLDKEQQNVLTSNSGIQRPSYAVAGTKWLDVSVIPWLLKMYDGTDDVVIGTIDPSTHLFTPTGVLPSQDGNSGKFLQTDGSKTVWTNAVDYTNITNCITEIPQDIKLELNNGVLTLKAGSKVYVPNGGGKFDEVVTIGDYKQTFSTNTGKYFVFIQFGNNLTNIASRYFSSETQSYSGSTAPTGANYLIWYDTTNNLIKESQDGGTSWKTDRKFTLPFCLVTVSSGTITSIDQVFNGFGYIGSTVFALPGVKGLIPNGRNEDGSLKNIEFTISKVVTQTTTTSFTDMPFAVNASNIQWIDYLGEFSTPPSVQQYKGYFNPIENKMYFAYTTDSWTQIDEAFCGRVSTNGKITSLTPKTTFHAVDYNDFKTGIDAKGGLEIGDVGFAPLGIDETQNKRRYLNGQVISQTQFATFTDKVKKAVALYPSLSATEENWQAEVTNSKLGQCGKFVIDDTAGTIRLPKVVNINGLTDLSLMGGIKAESLPNIAGDAGGFYSSAQGTPTGPFSGNATRGNGNVTSGASSRTAYFNASRSSLTYQDGAPVQQEAVQYPYFIQVATGSEESVDVTREIELNNPFFFGMHIWSDTAINNASWLISNGSYHSGATYSDFYQWLLKIHNGTLTVDGVSVKAYGASGITDYDYVINTADTTFRLPVKVKLASGNAVAGNGMTLGLTNGDLNLALGTGYGTSGFVVHGIAGYGNPVGTKTNEGGALNSKSMGITLDPTKSGIETSSQGLKLYFYVGETIQDANVINAAGVLTTVANKANADMSNVNPEWASAAGKPSGRYINLTLGATGSRYTAPANGWAAWGGQFSNAAGNFSIGNSSLYSQGTATSGAQYIGVYIPVKKGEIFYVDYGAVSKTVLFRFIYDEGSN